VTPSKKPDRLARTAEQRALQAVADGDERKSREQGPEEKTTLRMTRRSPLLKTAC